MNWDAKCLIYGQAISDLKWWIATLPVAAAPIMCPLLEMTLATDASDQGWGAEFQGRIAQGRFDPEQLNYHINTKEVIAAYYGILSFQPYFTKKHLLL